MALFRSASDRKQIGIIAEREFKKNRPQFISTYIQETGRAFGYILVDNQPDKKSLSALVVDIGYKKRCEIGRNSQNDQ